MSDIHSVREGYETLAETLNWLSKHGETIMLHPGSPGISPAISGYSGGVRWERGKAFGEGWESYGEGPESIDPPHGELQSIVDHQERPIYDDDLNDSDDDFDPDA